MAEMNEIKFGKTVAAISEQFVERDVRFIVTSFSRNDRVKLFILKTKGLRKCVEREWKK
jgi:hypothetical protein